MSRLCPSALQVATVLATLAVVRVATADPTTAAFAAPNVTSLATTASAGGPPFVTDDPEPVEFRHWEVYFASIYDNALGVTAGTLPHVEVNYGPAPNVQLHIIMPMSYYQPHGLGMQYGFGDTELGVKWRFVPESKSRPMVGTFPLVELPTGNSNRGLGNGLAQIFLPLWLQKSWGPWMTYGGAGYWHNPGIGNRDYWLAGWLGQYQVTKSLAVGVEVYHATRSSMDVGDRTSFNAGFIYDFDEVHHLLFSAGKDLHGPFGATGYIAYQWTFGPRERGEKSHDEQTSPKSY